MRLGLSGRIIEQGGGKYQMPTPEFIRFAAGIGYSGVELRPGQMHTGMLPAEVSEVAGALGDTGVKAIFLSSAVSVDSEAGLEQFRSLLLFADTLDADFIRVDVTESAIPMVRRACDAAAQHGRGVICQIHTGTLIDSVDDALDVCKLVDRDNFGVTYEPGNFILMGLDYGPAALKRLGSRLFQVSFQNIKPVAEKAGEGVIAYEGKGFRRCLIGDPAGVDIARMFDGLRQAHFDGFVTVIEPISPDTLPNLELARFIYDRFAPYVA